MAELNVTSVPWIDSGDAPPLALDRDKRDIISQGIADPLVDYDIVPLTYTNSRWSAFFYRVDEAALRRILPKCLDLEDDVVEFWYVDHLHTGLGPYGEMGVTVSASCKGQDGNTYYAGYYPYMYLTQDAAVFAGREPFGFPKKIAYIVYPGARWQGGRRLRRVRERLLQLHAWSGAGTSSTPRPAGTTTPSFRRSRASTATRSTVA